MKNTWQALFPYREGGDLETNNNGADGSLRGIAGGQRNWLFFGSNEDG